MIILIPTYNRPKKLARSLEFYARTGVSSKYEVIVLDGSPEAVGNINKTSCKDFGATHSWHPTRNYFERLTDAFSNLDDNQLVCLSPDEDVFFPEYLSAASLFLNENTDYTLFMGRYITYSKPLFGLHRVNFSRDTIFDLDLWSQNPIVRVNLFINALNVGCSPVFWGVRRAGIFRETLKLQEKMQLGSASEACDQVLMCLLGKVKLAPIPMMLRDETKIKEPLNPDSRDPDTYILQSDIDLAIDIFDQDYGLNGSLAVEMLTSFYSENYCDLDGKRLYSRIHQRPALNFRSYWGSKLEDHYMKYAAITSKIVLVIHEIFWALILRRVLSKKYGPKTVAKILKIMRND
jgi:glycosyltransferase domain-containing protein